MGVAEEVRRSGLGTVLLDVYKRQFTDFVFGIGSRLGIAGKFQEVFTHYLHFRERNMRGAMGI